MPGVQKLPNAAGGHIHTATGQGAWVPAPMTGISLEAYLDLAGGSATIEVHGSNIGAGVTPGEGTKMATFILNGVNDRASQDKPTAKYFYMCANVTAIAGGAQAEVAMGG